MDWKHDIRAALAGAGQHPDEDVVEELAHHAQAMYEAGRADGLSTDDAGRRVRDQLDRWQAEASRLYRRPGRTPAAEPPPADARPRSAAMAQDVRYAARLLRREPRFSLLVIVTMALAIGAATVLFSVAYGVLLKPLPWPGGDRLIELKETRGGHAPRFNSFSNAAYLAWRGDSAALDGIAAWAQRTTTLSGAGDPARIRITSASASLFTVLGTKPLLGSLFSEDDETGRNGPVVVISEALWRERFEGSPRALGRVVRLDGRPHTIIGVLPDRLAYPDRASRAWVPFHVPSTDGNHLSMFHAVARLRPGATAMQAASEGTARGRSAADTGMTTTAIFGGTGPLQVSAAGLQEATTREVRPALLVLLAAVFLLLFAAVANVAGLQLARAATRRREIAIRSAVGAGTARIVRQLLTENVLLGFAGGLAGLLFAAVLHRLLPAVLPADFPRRDELGIDPPVILFALAISVVSSMVFGLFPAFRVRRLDLVASLSAERASAAGTVRPSRVGAARVVVMAAQIAVACVLLVGASLLGRSFLALISADRGYDPANVLTGRLSLPDAMYTPERRYAMVHALLERLARLPGASETAFTSELPLTAGGSTAAFTMRHSGRLVSVQASPRIVSPEYFAALRMRIVTGRAFSDSDTETALPVVIVNRAFARRYLGDSPLGARLPMGAGYRTDGVEATVVGVVDDVRYLAGGESTQPEMYYSFRQFERQLGVPAITLLVRATSPAALATGLRAAVREVDFTLVPDAVVTMEDRVLTALARPRLYGILLGGFALFTLAITSVGLYGVLSHMVAQRSREIAVRSALGARPCDLVRLVVGQGLAIAVAGLVTGIAAAAILARFLSAFLYGVTPYDGMSYALVPLILLVVTGLACFVPARRAAHMDAIQILRSGL